MFTISSAETLTVNVPYQHPKKGPKEFKATWRLHKWDEYREMMKQQQEGNAQDEDLLPDLVKLDDVEDDVTGEVIPHCPELAGAVMQVAWMRRPLILSWFAAQEGRTQASAKN